MANGLSGVGYQLAYGSLSSDPTVVDGNTATGPDISGGVGNSALTGAVDLGASISLTGLHASVGYLNNCSIAVEYSLNSTAWSSLSVSSLPNHFASFALETVNISANFTARYLRLSVADSGNSGGAYRVSIREVTATGVNAYVEAVMADAGVKPSGVDTVTDGEAPTVKAGFRPQSDEVFMHGAGGMDFTEPNLVVKAGFKPSSTHSGNASDVVTAKIGLRPSEADVQGNSAVSNHYYAAPAVLEGAKALSSDTAAYMEAPSVNAGLRPRAADNAAVSVNGTAKLGLLPSAVSANGYVEVATVKAGFKPSGSETFTAAVQSITANLGVLPSGVDVLSASSVSQVMAGVKPSVADVAASAEARTVKAGINVALSAGVFASTDSAATKAGAKASGVDGQAMVDAVAAKVGVKVLASAGETRGYSDVVMAALGFKPSAVDRMATGD